MVREGLVLVARCCMSGSVVEGCRWLGVLRAFGMASLVGGSPGWLRVGERSMAGVIQVTIRSTIAKMPCQIL